MTIARVERFRVRAHVAPPLLVLLLAAAPAFAQGVTVSGVVLGLPEAGILVPPASPISAWIATPVSRGGNALPLPIVFPPELRVRTHDGSLRTRIANGQTLDPHLFQENGSLLALLIRETPTITLAGTVASFVDESGGSTALTFSGFCQDPRECVQGSSRGTLVLALEPALQSAVVSLEVNGTASTSGGGAGPGDRIRARVMPHGNGLLLVHVECVACAPFRPDRALLPSGMDLIGVLGGLPPEGLTLPTAASVPGWIGVSGDRGRETLPVPIVFSPGLAVRSLEGNLQTHVSNGDLVQLHVFAESAQLTVVLLREAPTLSLTGRVVNITDDNGNPAVALFTAKCSDPRVCAEESSPLTLTLDLDELWAGTQVTIKNPGMAWLVDGLPNDVRGLGLGDRIRVRVTPGGSELLLVRADLLSRTTLPPGFPP